MHMDCEGVIFRRASGPWQFDVFPEDMSATNRARVLPGLWLFLTLRTDPGNLPGSSCIDRLPALVRKIASVEMQ